MKTDFIVLLISTTVTSSEHIPQPVFSNPLDFRLPKSFLLQLPDVLQESRGLQTKLTSNYGNPFPPVPHNGRNTPQQAKITTTINKASETVSLGFERWIYKPPQVRLPVSPTETPEDKKARLRSPREYPPTTIARPTRNAEHRQSL